MGPMVVLLAAVMAAAAAAPGSGYLTALQKEQLLRQLTEVSHSPITITCEALMGLVLCAWLRRS